MRKNFLSAILIFVALALITGCTKGTSTSYNRDKETETVKPQPTEPPTLYAINPLFENEKITKIIILNEFDEGDITVEITSEQKIKEIISMFNNWDMEANKVPENRILDSELYIGIIFNDNLIMHISPSCGQEDNYYGNVGHTYYYLPQEFWEYVYDKIK